MTESLGVGEEIASNEGGEWEDGGGREGGEEASRRPSFRVRKTQVPIGGVCACRMYTSVRCVCLWGVGLFLGGCEMLPPLHCADTGVRSLLPVVLGPQDDGRFLRSNHGAGAFGSCSGYSESISLGTQRKTSHFATLWAKQSFKKERKEN